MDKDDELKLINSIDKNLTHLTRYIDEGLSSPSYLFKETVIRLTTETKELVSKLKSLKTMTEYEIIDEIGRLVTYAILNTADEQKVQDILMKSKDLLNKLKSLKSKELPNVHSS